MVYLLKAVAVISLFYLCYRLFLKEETFFRSNRWFLLSGVFLALIIPLILIPVYTVKKVPTITNSFIPFTSSQPVIETQTFAWEQSALFIYMIGVLLLLARFIIQITSLYFLIKKGNIQKIEGYRHVITSDSVSPFSIFKWIVYNPKLFKKEELKQILLHEKVHVDEFHSVDMLSMHLASILFWFNPLIWLYKKDLEQNLEFIADHSTQKNSKCQKSYQKLLLKTSIPNYQLELANNFYNSLIKKRIVMLQKNRSKRSSHWKIAFIIPILAIFLMSFNTKEIVVYEPTEYLEWNETYNSLDEFEIVMITKEMSDEDLKAISSRLKEKEITLKFKGVKRNKNNEITDISITAKTERSSANINESNDKGITPIRLTIKDNYISFDEAHEIHEEGDYSFISKDNYHRIKTTGNRGNVFVFSDSKHEHDENEEQEHEFEINDDDNTFIIRKGDEVHEIKKIHSKKNNNVYIISGNDDNKFEIISADSIELNNNNTKLKGNVVIRSDENDKDSNVFIIKKDINGNIIKEWKEGEDIEWKDKEGKKFTVRSVGKGNNSFFISTDSDNNPLIILDGKEISQNKLDQMNKNKIEKVEVLKGESALKKYGDKAKDGVIVITSKKE